MGDPGSGYTDELELTKHMSTVDLEDAEYFSPTSFCSSSPPPVPEPPAEEVEAAITNLCAALKVICAPTCPEHPELFYCHCPAALATLTPKHHYALKRETFCRLFDAEVLRYTTHAFDYDGSKEAHDFFVYKTGGLTPKHWLRDWLAMSLASTVFAPARKIKDAIQALLDYWVLRTQQWRARYRSLHMASESAYFETEYALHTPTDKMREPPLTPPSTTDPGPGLLKYGDEMLVLKCAWGPVGHEDNNIEVSPMSVLARGFGVRYHVWEKCHEECEEVTARRQQFAANWLANDLAARCGYGNCWSGKGNAQEEAEGVWAKLRF